MEETNGGGMDGDTKLMGGQVNASCWGYTWCGKVVKGPWWGR